MFGIVRNWLTYRGTHILTCPENHEHAAVRVALGSNGPHVHLRSCTRWPEREGCSQGCVAELEAAPEKTLVQAVASDWYTGKSCVYCAEPIGMIVWHDRPPALRAEDGSTREWKDVAPHQLPDVLATHQPVCWRCHVTESFRRDHPAWVIERTHETEEHDRLRPSTSVY